MYAITGANVFTGERTFKNYAVICKDDKILSITPENLLDNDIKRVELNGGTLCAGFIDIQVNGGGGVLLNNAPTVESLKKMVTGHRQFGTTGMMPTMISDTSDVVKQGVKAAQAAIEDGVSEVLGIHIEGPFFNPARRGAHLEEHIREINDDDLTWPSLLPDGKFIYTIAPEMTTSQRITQILQTGAKICVGHTGANYDEVKIALDLGVDGFTHLHNAMTPMQGRAPGVVGAALESQEAWVGVIVDGHHVHSATLKTSIAAKPKGKVVLVTDAMATVGSDEKSFRIYDETIFEKDGKLVNAEGNLAGAAISMIEAVENATKLLDLPLEEAIRMASLYPAQYLGLGDSLGLLKSGYKANMVHFSDNFDVTSTWVAGQIETY
jgi:N-acetylglucosamine-6-phosphate deacetylase